MFNYTGIKHRFAVLTALAATLCVAAACPQAGYSCDSKVSWTADLTGSSAAPAVQTQATGKATYLFDFEHPDATIQVDTQHVQDVTQVVLRAANSDHDLNGPVLLTLYKDSGSPFPSTFSKTVTNADVIKQATPSVANLMDVANIVLGHKAVVVVCTKAHPEGEIAGVIAMHKYFVYSDDPNSKFHDPSLHAHHAPQPAAASSAAPAAIQTAAVKP